MGGFEYVMVAAAEFAPNPTATKKDGFCCVPGMIFDT
jgi:hypothetical protein